MSVRLTSSGLQGDYGRPVYTIYFNGKGVTGTNYPIGSVIQVYQDSYTSLSFTGKWNGFDIGSRSDLYVGISSLNLVGGTLVIFQRIS